MRILVLSDAHGDRKNVTKAIEEQKDADKIIFLGDSGDAMEDYEYLFANKMYSVAGNCDFGSNKPSFLSLSFEGHSLFALHGHQFQVKFGIGRLVTAAKARGAEIILFGHTHTALSEYIDGMYFLNPGSVSRRGSSCPSYGIVDITPQGIITNTIKL